ncbi:hypothetical protein LH20_19030 [Sphingopyxis sp. 113P3]|nr:hypothetical protein LH20_19030 [Sphingopyxis sp. 113P3]
MSAGEDRGKARHASRAIAKDRASPRKVVCPVLPCCRDCALTISLAIGILRIRIMFAPALVPIAGAAGPGDPHNSLWRVHAAPIERKEGASRSRPGRVSAIAFLRLSITDRQISRS